MWTPILEFPWFVYFFLACHQESKSLRIESCQWRSTSIEILLVAITSIYRMKTHEKAYRPWKRVHQWSRVCCGPAGHFFGFLHFFWFSCKFWASWHYSIPRSRPRGRPSSHILQQPSCVCTVSHSNQFLIVLYLFCICFILFFQQLAPGLKTEEPDRIWWPCQRINMQPCSEPVV